MPVNSVVLVSGFAGSGKTTLIDQLVSGQLPGDLRDRFPKDCAQWPQLNGIDIRNGHYRLIPADEVDNPASGLVLHYEINHFQRGGLRPYETDPVFSELAAVPRIIIVIIRPSVDQLIAQFSDRAMRKARRKGRWHELFRKSVRKPVQDLGAYLRGERYSPYDVLYQDGDWLRSCATAWDSFVRTWTSTKSQSSFLCLRPTSGSWSIIEPLPPEELLPIDFSACLAAGSPSDRQH